MTLKLHPNPEETIWHISQQIRDRKISCEQILQRCLNQFDTRESEIQAFVELNREEALQTACELDEQLARGNYLGPLHGIPVGIKDIIDVAGFPTGAGSELRRQTIVDSDATVTQKLKSAGAVILGKTVTTQFAYYDPPVTKNPWNVERTPGGSSSGSAAAVASGMCLAAIGSQTGGSITRPAAFCGIAGCKPTFGRVGRQGVVPIDGSLDHVGPLTRCVKDLAIVLDAIAGFDSNDAGSLQNSELSISNDLALENISAPRIGLLTGFFRTDADAEMTAAIDHSIAAYRKNGADVREVALPSEFANFPMHHRTMMAYGTAQYHSKRFDKHPDDYLPGMSSLIVEGRAISEDEYEQCKDHQRNLKQAVESLFTDVDILVCPASVGAAPDTSTTGDPKMNAPWSYTGLPTVSFPIAKTSDDMPLAIQLVGNRLQERELFQAAAWCEDVTRNSIGQ